MSLSGRELWIILRARDEASRTVSRVSSNLRGMNKGRAQESARAIEAQRSNLRRLQTQLGDVNHAYSKTSTSAYESMRRQSATTREQTMQVRLNENAVRDAYRETVRQTQKQRYENKITAGQFQQQMLKARTLYQEQIAQLRDERFAIQRVEAASKQLYAEQIANARKLHVTQAEQIRQQRLAADQAIQYHRQQLQQFHQEEEAMRQRGHALMANGSAAVGFGASMIFAGAVGLRAMASNIKASMDYETQASRTLTQVDKTHASLSKILAIGKAIGNQVPVDFNQIQPALYDIFSSIDVGYNGARKLLKQFSKDAVGGQASLETATRANVAIMNAYGISVKHSTRVSDFMFQLVRKGVGTYQDFASTIGLAIPSAARLGVTLSELGGTLAFMTRNGLSASRASTSAARAFDALSNPKTAKNLKSMGVDIVDAKGNLKAFPDILDLMMSKMKNLNNFQKSKFLKDAFYGSGGTIQALRFFNLVFRHMDEFKQRVKEMDTSSNTAKKAFQQMATSPQAQLQKLKNHFELLRIEMGTYLLPIALKLVGWADRMIKAWNGLSPATQKNITQAIALTAIFVTLAGVVTAGAGALAIFVGMSKTMGQTSGMLAGKIGIVTAGLSGMAFGMYQAYKATDNTHRAVGILYSTMGGAAAGSVFGPWGAAIGGVVGALGGLVAAMHNASDSSKPVAANYKDLASTLDQLTGATTAATRASILHQLQVSGTLKALSTYGINSRTAISAILNEGSARKVVTAALKSQSYAIIDQRKQIALLTAANVKDAKAGTLTPQRQTQRKQQIDALKAQIAAEQNVAAAVRKGIPATHDAIKAAQRRAFALQDLNGKLNGLPKEKRIRITADGVFPTVKGIAKVAKEYRLTPKQIRIVISATGVNATVKDVEKAKKSLKGIHEVKTDITPYLNSIRAGAHSVAGESREIGQTAQQNLQKGPKEAHADLSKYTSSIKAGVQAARGIASSGGHSVGMDLGTGVVQGFADSGAARQLASDAASAVNAAIANARKAAKAHSPSRRMMQLGKDLADGLSIGYKKTITANLKSMQRATDYAMKKGEQNTRRHASGIRHWLSTLNKKNIVPRARQLNKDLDAAQAKLKNLISKQKQYNQTVKSSVTSYGSLGSMVGQTDVFGNDIAPDVTSISSGLKERLATIRHWKTSLKRLLKAGFSKSIYNQVVQMGPEDGVAYADALLQATPSQVRQINRMNSQINNAANQIANASAREMYQSGIKAAQGLINGLKSKEKALERVASRMGKAIVKAIKKALGIHSPSKVAHQLGSNFGGTFAKSLRQQARDVRRASGDLGNAVNMNLTKPSLSDKGWWGGGPRPPANGTQVVHHHKQEITIPVTQTVQNPVQYAQQLGFELDRRFPKR